MPDSFSIKQQLTLKQFTAATLLYYFKSKKVRLFFLFITALTLGSFLLGFATTSKQVMVASVLASLAPIFLLMLVLVAFVFFTCIYIYKNKPYLFNNVTYEITHWGVIRHGERTEFSKPWRDISAYRESRNFFLLYVANTDFHIIQKSMFKDDSELNSFRAMLEEKIRR
jgi:hypothetical protein